MSHPRLSIIPAGAIFDRSLEPRDLQVLGLLGIYTDKAGWCRRSQVKMAAQLKCGRSSVQRSLENLVVSGWVEKKRPPWSNAEGPPSNSYMYRVVLDRDDFDINTVMDDPRPEGDESYAENASEEGVCPPMGTPQPETDDSQIAAKNSSEGAQHGGHPGAHPYVGTGARTYVGTKNDPLERPLLERERDARARDRKVKFLNSFEARWPTAAADDRQRTAYAAEALTEPEESEALAGIAPFLENLKRLKRTTCPAGWNYLEQKRWTLLEAQKAAGAPSPTSFARGSPEFNAITVLHELAGRSSSIRSYLRNPDGSISFRKPMTAQLLKLADATAPDAEYVVLTRRGAASWERMLRAFFDSGLIRKHLKEGDRAPWAWAPSAEGKLYPAGTEPPEDATGPPETLMAEGEAEDFK